MGRETLTIEAANFYVGRLVPPNLIVVHATSGRRDRQESAVGVARYFAGGAPGSTQWVSDDVVDVRCVRDDDTCWGAKGHNSNGLHFEFCGHADWSIDDWMTHRPTLDGGAVKIAEAMKRYKIPFVYPAPIINGKAQNGIHTHYKLPGNDHTDPAPGPSRSGQFPMGYLLEQIKRGLGLGHTLGTSKPAQAVRSLADIQKRNIITVRFIYADGSKRIWQGWKECKDVLAYLMNDGELRSTTLVQIAWQGKWFQYPDQQRMRNIATSIYTRYA